MPSTTVIILGAAEPFAGTKPSALVQTPGDRRVLDWNIEAFQTALEDPEIHFVGGYRLETVVEEYPDIHFSMNEDWEETGAVTSLFSAPVPDEGPVLVCYADTVFETSVIRTMDDGEGATIAVDRTWQDRYWNRSDESLERAEKVRLVDGELADIGSSLRVSDSDAEFTGLMWLSSGAIERAMSLWDARTIGQTAGLPTLARALAATDVPISVVGIGGRWAELETPTDLSRFVLDTKANTLRRLESRVKRSVILDQYTFSVSDWEDRPGEICAGISDQFDGNAVIVRSSTRAEDGWEESNAGAFESVLNVPSDDERALRSAVDEVIVSYPDDRRDNQVLVQPMIEDVSASGVAMTRSLDTGSPYYVINYDATTASTETVTDGTGDQLQTAVILKDIVTEGGSIGVEMDRSRSQWSDDIAMEPLLSAIRELEDILGHDRLDIEFAIDESETVCVLQIRPMTLDHSNRSVDDDTVMDIVEASRSTFTESQERPPQLIGDRSIYGVMPDWNPAEIIGRRPRQLAASLYRYLVMDEVWATQRAEYGYRDVRPAPLMQSFAGQPYVDVRADVNSFIPATVPDGLAERLVEYYIDRLNEHPELHDKLEFEIVLTCLTFDYDDQIEPLLEAGFTRDELEPLREGLREITRGGMECVQDNLETIDRLEDRYEAVMRSNMSPLRRAYQLLDDCRRYGTLPFAHLARTAFVATSLLRSLERVGVLQSANVTAFQNSLNTVARRFERDGERVATGEMDRETFVERYGHLRPGTYELTSPRYDADPENYLDPMTAEPEAPTTDGGQSDFDPADRDPHDVWDDSTKAAIAAELDRIGLDSDIDRFVEFLVEAIEGREYAKFVFSRNLSAALEQLAAFGAEHGLSREACSHVRLDEYLACFHDQPAPDLEAWLEMRAQEGRDRYATTTAVELPPLLIEPADFVAFEQPEREANFVTDATVNAELVVLEDHDGADLVLDGKVVLIPQADPGYDWLFGHDIAGLITKYGGVNSHMAVRAAEFSLPAAIGVGGAVYESLKSVEIVELDCGSMDVNPV